MDWYKMSVKDVFSKTISSDFGLTEFEVKERIAKYGQNKLPEKKTKGYFFIFIDQFRSPIIYILFGAAIIVFLLNELVDFFIILSVLVINAIVGTIQEGKAENTLNALKHFVATKATVIRDKKEIIVDDSEIVYGDVVVLHEGDKVPADLRLISVEELEIDESTLTGESKSVFKNVEHVYSKDLPVSDQKNMVFKGTYVVGGQGLGIVVATGKNTYIGGISEKLSSIDADVPLKKNINNLSKLIIITVVVAGLIIFFAGILQGFSVKDMFVTVVAVAVSAIPEGLPVVVTLVLATGVYRMSKKNALVKRLQAVEALGQAKIIAVDKTGTVTFNQMMVSKIFVDDTVFEVGGNGYEPKGEIISGDKAIDPIGHQALVLAGKISLLNATASVAYSSEKKEWLRVHGDPTEAALLVFSEKIGFDKEIFLKENPKVFEILFNSKNKYRLSVNMDQGKKTLFITGAPEVIFSKTKNVFLGGKIVPMTKEYLSRIEKVMSKMSSEGLRLIALAFSETILDKKDGSDPSNLCFVGVVGINDGLRPEVLQSVKDAQSAGIRVVMITGDHVDTAKAIAKKANIFKEGDIVITGENLVSWPEGRLILSLPSVSVFARVSPEDKLKIVELYKKSKQVVAMTGDGVNDALSLAAADLGVSMGKNGTEVAKEASDIILLDDNFGSIVSAVEEGRNIYQTIKKVILYLFSTSVGELLVIAVAIFISFPLPVVASQIIWLNFVTDGFLVVALAMEPKSVGLLLSFKKNKAIFFDKMMIQRMLLMASVMMIGSLILFSFYKDGDYVKATTVALTTLAVFQWFNAWNCRSHKKSVLTANLFENKFLIVATGIVITLQILAVYAPFMNKILKTSPLNLFDWLIIISVASSVIVVEEIRKWIYVNLRVSKKEIAPVRY